MGFRIRDKSLFWTTAGWKNNWEPKILNMPRPLQPSLTAYITTRNDHHSYLRMVQSYRNYSRILKQYMYGDQQAINLLILELRTVFKVPFRCETPVELIKHGGQKRMADQLDRDYELMSYNTHPMQLFIYELRNKYIRANNQQADKIEKGEETLMSAFTAELEKEAKLEQSKLGQGQKLSLEKITEVYKRVAKAAYSIDGDLSARREDGQFNDFLEKRRPFMAPNPTGHSH